MSKYFRLAAMILMAIVMLTLVGGVFAQEATPEVYTAAMDEDNSPYWLETPMWFTTGAEALNLRGSPTTQRNTVIGSAPKGSVIQAVAEMPSLDWYLARVQTPDGAYYDAWLNEPAAQLTPMTAEASAAFRFNEQGCEVEDTGKLKPNVLTFDEGWVVDKYFTTCNMAVEGQQVLDETHQVWIVRSTGGTMALEDTHGFLYYRQGSIWIYDKDWNMEDRSEHNIADELVSMKRAGMVNNISVPHNWAIQLTFTSGRILLFPAGGDVPPLDPDSMTRILPITSPMMITVNGIFDSGSESFTASIGDEELVTVALLVRDGQFVAEEWVGTRDLVTFESVLAWYMPQDWTQDEIDSWFESEVRVTDTDLAGIEISFISPVEATPEAPAS